jgi:TBC1 domain family protein 5
VSNLFSRHLANLTRCPAGFDKALFSTVSTLSELRVSIYHHLSGPLLTYLQKNFPELPATSSAPSFPFRSYTPEGTTPSGNSQFPNLDSLSSHLPPAHIPPRTLKDADREIAELRLAMVGMGKSMAHWIEALEDPQTSTEVESRQAALEGLRRLQKTLIDGATTTTNELKQWAWSTDLASTPSVSSMTSGNPLETGDSTDDIEFAALRNSQNMEQDFGASDQTPTKDDIPLPPNTFALETSPSKSAFRTPTYLHPAGQFARRSDSPTPREAPSTLRSTAPQARLTARVSSPVASPPVSVTVSGEPEASPAQSVLAHDVDDAGIATATHPSTNVDPLSGLTVSSEPGSTHAYGNKRLSKDPLRGLGIL